MHGTVIPTTKPIPTYENMYLLLREGEVDGVDRKTRVIKEGREFWKEVKGRRLKTKIHADGSKHVTLSRGNEHMSYRMADLLDWVYEKGPRAVPTSTWYTGTKAEPKAKAKASDVKSKAAPKEPVRKKAKPEAPVQRVKVPEPAPAVADLFADIDRDIVEAVFTRHWTLTRGRKDVIPDSGLQNFCIEFGLSLHQVKEIIFFRAHKSITEPLFKRLAK